MNKITYWLDWEKKIVKPNKESLKEIPWEKISKYPLTIYCDQNTWPYINLYSDKEEIITDWKKRTHQVGKATIKEIRGGTEENREGLGTQAFKLLCELEPEFINSHPRTGKDFWKISNDWKFAPRFENLQEGIFKNVSKIDIKSCYVSIMRDYPLPCGEPKWISDPTEIKKKLKAGEEGFVSFKIIAGMVIKNNQIPFLPNHKSEIKTRMQGRFFCYSKLFKEFKEQYVRRDRIRLAGLWAFPEKKGCINHFLDYCEELKKTDEKKGKMLANSLYGYLGKNSFIGYHYHPFHLAVNHLAILKTYYLYRQFKKENVLAIRSDCIYIKGRLPVRIKQEKVKYHIEKYKKVAFQGEEDIFIYDTQELKARQEQGEKRQELINWFLRQGRLKK